MLKALKAAFFFVSSRKYSMENNNAKRHLTLHARLFLIICILLGGGLRLVMAANSEPAQVAGGDVLRAFERRFALMDTLLANARMVRQPLLLYVEPWQTDSLFDEQTHWEIAAMRRNIGLEITGQVYQRLDGTFGFDDEDAYSRYDTKLQGELGWDIFGSSIVRRKTRTRQLELKGELRRLSAQRSDDNQPWERVAEEMERRYAEEKISVMRYRLENTRLLNTAYDFTLRQEKESSARMLSAINDIMDIERQLSILGDNVMESTTDTIHLPQATLILVDSTALLSSIVQTNPELKSLAIQSELLDTERRLTNYANTMRLTPFARVSHYLRTGVGNLGTPSTNIDVGVRFTFPLYGSSKAKRRALSTERTLNDLTIANLHDEAIERCRQLLTRVERLNAAIATEARHLKQIEAFIDRRRDAYLHSSTGYDYTLRLEEYNEWLRVVEQFYNLLRDRNTTLLQMQRLSRHEHFETLIIEQPI